MDTGAHATRGLQDTVSGRAALINEVIGLPLTNTSSVIDWERLATLVLDDFALPPYTVRWGTALQPEERAAALLISPCPTIPDILQSYAALSPWRTFTPASG